MMLPLAPLYSWLQARLSDAQQVASIAKRTPSITMLGSLDSFDVDAELLDVRHGPTRYAVLRALADAGHSRPWALGAPWSPLTDEQAGRATAEILRAVGEDPSKPVGVVPIAVLNAYEDGFSRGKRHFRRRLHEALWYNYHVYHQFQIHEVFEAPHQEDGVSIGWHIAGVIASTSKDIAIYGPEIGDAGRLAADNAARNLGCLFIEELTP